MRKIGNNTQARYGLSGHGSSGLVQFLGSHLTISGEANEIGYLGSHEMAVVGGHTQVGFAFQSTVPVTIDYTLCPIADAINEDPQVQSGVIWSDTLNVTARQIVPSVVQVFTALRIKFNSKGLLYIAAL
jgi:hypothetical protein